MHRPTRNLVIASEKLPPVFQPANQVRLVPASPANPVMLPGMGDVRLANGMHSNGLAPQGQDRRFALLLAQHRLKEAQAAGAPNALARPSITVPLAQALAALPTAPVEALVPQKGGQGGWEHVETLKRSAGSRWVITKQRTPTAWRFAVALYRRRGQNDDEVVRSDNLASAKDAREYIRAWEVRHGNLATVGKPKTMQYWAGILRKPTQAGATSAWARRNKRFQVINTPAPQAPDADEPAGYSNLTRHERKMLAVDGLGSIAPQPLVMGGLVIGALYALHLMQKRA